MASSTTRSWHDSGARTITVETITAVLPIAVPSAARLKLRSLRERVGTRPASGLPRCRPRGRLRSARHTSRWRSRQRRRRGRLPRGSRPGWGSGPRPAAVAAMDESAPGDGMALELAIWSHVAPRMSRVSASTRSSATAATVASSSAATAATLSAALATDIDISVTAHVPLYPALAKPLSTVSRAAAVASRRSVIPARNGRRIRRCIACRLPRFVRRRDDHHAEVHPGRMLKQGGNACSCGVSAWIGSLASWRLGQLVAYAPAAARLSSRMARAVDTSSAVVTSGGMMRMTFT